jgi:hypothetical protein
MSVVVEIQKNVIEVIVEVSAVANDIAAANAKRAEDANNSAQEALQEITDLEAQITPKINEGLDDIEQARTGALSDIDTAKTGAVDELNTAKTEGVDAVNTAKTEGVDAVNTAKTTALSEINPLVTAAQTAKQGAEDAETRIEGIEQNVILLEGQAQGAANTAIQSNTDTQSLLTNFFDPAIIALNSRIVADGGTVVIKLRFVQQELDLLTA